MASRKRTKRSGAARSYGGCEVEFPRLELRIIPMITCFSRARDSFGRPTGATRRGAATTMRGGGERREDNFRDTRFNGAKVTNNWVKREGKAISPEFTDLLWVHGALERRRTLDLVPWHDIPSSTCPYAFIIGAESSGIWRKNFRHARASPWREE